MLLEHLVLDCRITSAWSMMSSGVAVRFNQRLSVCLCRLRLFETEMFYLSAQMKGEITGAGTRARSRTHVLPLLLDRQHHLYSCFNTNAR